MATLTDLTKGRGTRDAPEIEDESHRNQDARERSRYPEEAKRPRKDFGSHWRFARPCEVKARGAHVAMLKEDHCATSR